MQKNTRVKNKDTTNEVQTSVSVCRRSFSRSLASRRAFFFSVAAAAFRCWRACSRASFFCILASLARSRASLRDRVVCLRASDCDTGAEGDNVDLAEEGDFAAADSAAAVFAAADVAAEGDDDDDDDDVDDADSDEDDEDDEDNADDDDGGGDEGTGLLCNLRFFALEDADEPRGFVFRFGGICLSELSDGFCITTT